MGVQPGWVRAWPRAEISPPEHHPCPRLGLLGVYRFFFARIESPLRFPKWWIAFRLPCPSSSTLSRVSSAFPSQRLQNRVVFHVFSSAVSHLSSQQLLGLRETSRSVGQARSGVLLHRWYVFSFLICFFFANFLFAAQLTPSTLLANRHGPPLPRAPISSNY
jgi:hypothetical protein